MSEKKRSLKELLDKLVAKLQGLQRYSLVLFIVLIALVYGFILFRIKTLNDTQPSADAIAAQVKAAQVPHIDEAAIKQLQSLQDNSVNVKTLFNEARSNPFQ